MAIRSLIQIALLLAGCLTPAGSAQTDAPAAVPEEEIVLEGHSIPVEELEKKPDLDKDERLLFHVIRDGREAPEGVREREEIAYFVHLRGSVLESARPRIEETGAEILSADAASDSFLVLMNGEQSKKVEALEEVDLVRPRRALDKLSAELDAVRQGASVQAAEDSQQTGTADASSMLELVFVLLPDRPYEDFEKEVGQAKGTIRSRTQIDGSWVLKVSLPPAALEGIASLNVVRRVEFDTEAVAFNDLAGRMIGIPDLLVPLTGTGQVIGHADSGIDLGVDSSLHGDLAGQIVESIPIGRSGDWSDPTGHGTHTAATLVGTGIGSGGVYRGIAPGAKLIHQSLIDSQGAFQIPANPEDLYGTAYLHGARIHSDSWGTITKGFDRGTSAYDPKARNIDSWTWNNGQPMKMLIVCAAGNYGPGERTLSGTATSKNCLTVGATGNGTRSDSVLDAYEHSSRGPAEGERRKPDLVAPGAWIASARTRAAGTAWQYDLETDSGWPPPTGFSVDTADAHSGKRSWVYKQEAGSEVEKSLRTRPFVVPSGFPVYLEFAAKGKLPPGGGVRVTFRRAGKGAWVGAEDLETLFESRWRTLAFRVPPQLQGVNIEAAIEIFSPLLAEAAEIRVDDIRLSTFHDGGDLSDFSLAQAGDPLDQLYTLKTGTSMSTPVVAGAAALLRQFLQEKGVAEPSAELLKAMLINGATRSGPPDFDRGWGVLNLRGSLPNRSRPVLYQEGTLRTGNTSDLVPFEVRDGGEPLRITLVWCDAPGARLTNDLNLVVHGPDGALHYPFGASAENPDTVNNVEGMDLSNPTPGPWQVEVTGKLGQGPQPYVLIVSGGVQTPPGSALGRISAD